MATPQKEPVTADQRPAVAIEPVPERRVTFRDTLYTSRSLILPADGRMIPVAKARVAVLASDSQAIAFLKEHPEFEALAE